MAGCAPTDMPNGLPSTRSSKTSWAVLTWRHSVAAKAGIGIQGKPFCSGRIPFEPTARTYQKNRLSSSQLYLVCIKDLYSSLGLNAAISPCIRWYKKWLLVTGPFHVQHRPFCASNISIYNSYIYISDIPSKELRDINLHKASYGFSQMTSSLHAPVDKHRLLHLFSFSLPDLCAMNKYWFSTHQHIIHMCIYNTYRSYLSIWYINHMCI